MSKRFELYNNIATLEGNEGRLRAEMIIDPYPRIEWNFEVLGKSTYRASSGEYEGTVNGYRFKLESTHGVLANPYSSDSVLNYAYIGTAAHAYAGDWENNYQRVTGLIPNARCIVRAMIGGLRAEEYRMLYTPDQRPDPSSLFLSSMRLGGWECVLNSDWAIRLTFSDEGRTWLESGDSQGTLLTVQAELTYDNKRDDASEEMQSTPRFLEAKEVLEQLCDYLSFANGGYLGPVVIRAKEGITQQPEAALYGAYVITPIELLGETWLSLQCNLCDYLSCFPAFEQMMKSEQWTELYQLLLIWYFQAIQPTSAQLRGKHWQVSIVALAALLERLTYEIGFELLGQKVRGKAQEKLKFMLEKIGVTNNPLHDDEQMIEYFYELRNNATHPRQSKVYSAEEINFGFDYATLWVEEIMLWRLGYKGKYRNRIRREGNYVFDTPRYDVSTRHPSWM